VTAAATRGSAGVEVLSVSELEGGALDEVVVPELRDVADDVLVELTDALGPGFGDPLLLQPPRAVIDSATIDTTTNRNGFTDHLADQG